MKDDLQTDSAVASVAPHGFKRRAIHLQQAAAAPRIGGVVDESDDCAFRSVPATTMTSASSGAAIVTIADAPRVTRNQRSVERRNVRAIDSRLHVRRRTIQASYC